VVDVEATCWKKGVFSRKKETIEIGAVLLQLDRAESSWPEFQTFVRPRRLPRLSSFCRELTGITQESVDAAPTFPEALQLFLEWSQPLERVVLATWSRYDLWQPDLDLEAHQLPNRLLCPLA
jgi:inhibitor of KinA sporulation pathway (predicted exonuclease)